MFCLCLITEIYHEGRRPSTLPIPGLNIRQGLGFFFSQVLTRTLAGSCSSGVFSLGNPRCQSDGGKQSLRKSGWKRGRKPRRLVNSGPFTNLLKSCQTTQTTEGSVPSDWNPSKLQSATKSLNYPSPFSCVCADYLTIFASSTSSAVYRHTSTNPFRRYCESCILDTPRAFLAQASNIPDDIQALQHSTAATPASLRSREDGSKQTRARRRSF